jgi:hypothetical protein
MGGVNTTLSTSITNITNEVVNNITNKMEKNCESKSENKQMMKIILNNIRGCSLNLSEISQGIDSKIDMNCVQSSITKTELKTVLKNSLDQLTESLRTCGSLALVETTASTSIVNLRNVITNDIVIDDLMNAMNKTVNTQNKEIIIDGYDCPPITTKDAFGNKTVTPGSIDINNLTQVIKSDVVMKALQDSKALTSAVIEVDNDLKIATSATALGVFDGIAASWGPMVMIAAIFIIGGGIFAVMKAKNKGVDGVPQATVVNENDQQQYTSGGGGGGGGGGEKDLSTIWKWAPVLFIVIAMILVFVSAGS